MKFLEAIPQEARGLYGKHWFLTGDAQYRSAAKRLVESHEMRSCWKKLARACGPEVVDAGGLSWPESFVQTVIALYLVARTDQDPWSMKTHAAQEKWISSFASTVEKLQGLIEDGPSKHVTRLNAPAPRRRTLSEIRLLGRLSLARVQHSDYDVYGHVCFLGLQPRAKEADRRGGAVHSRLGLLESPV